MINSISFDSNTRTYPRHDANNRNVSCYTTMFRNDIQWEKFANFLLTRYKDAKNVNIISGACSDGSEAYSLAISLINADREKSKKFFPIKDYDVDEQILDSGVNGYIYFNYGDLYELESRGATKDDEFFSIYDKKIKRKMRGNSYPGAGLFGVSPLLKFLEMLFHI